MSGVSAKAALAPLEVCRCLSPPPPPPSSLLRTPEVLHASPTFPSSACCSLPSPFPAPSACCAPQRFCMPASRQWWRLPGAPDRSASRCAQGAGDREEGRGRGGAKGVQGRRGLVWVIKMCSGAERRDRTDSGACGLSSPPARPADPPSSLHSGSRTLPCSKRTCWRCRRPAPPSSRCTRAPRSRRMTGGPTGRSSPALHSCSPSP